MSDKYFAVFARTDNFTHGRHQKKQYLLSAWRSAVGSVKPSEGATSTNRVYFIQLNSSARRDGAYK